MKKTKQNIWNGLKLNSPMYALALVSGTITNAFVKFGTQGGPVAIMSLLATQAKYVQDEEKKRAGKK